MGPEDSGNEWINGLYLTVITVTTIGFGDFSPQETDGLKFFSCALMIIGIPASAAALSLGTQMVFGEQRASIRLKLLQAELDQTSFEGLNEFVRNMRTEGVGNYNR